MDMEKVIKGLEMCDIYTDDLCSKNNCPYFWDGCRDKLKKDIITMLKGQDSCENCAIAIEDRQPVIRCKECINCAKEPNGELYCDILAVGYEPLGSKKVNEDWFCADGVKKE